MISRLENDKLSVEISSKGTELQSVICDDVERIWCGDLSVWGRRAPLLFPIIGRLRDGYFELDGKRIDHPMHGFCRDREFDIVSSSPTEVVYQTVSDDGTRAVYPFDFSLQVKYKLDGNTLVKTHVITNTGEDPMPFEIGGHEAYATRLLKGEHMSDYYVRFDDVDSIEMFQMDEDGILGIPKIGVTLPGGRLEKTPEQLSIDTIILEGVPNSQVTLAATTNDMTATVKFDDFPYLGIWTMAGQEDARYLCIEPWSALPDGHFFDRELTKHPGVITVNPGESSTLTYSMTFE